ncbi:MAG TPA: anthranilate phosphoribosyltransferase [Planctomycetaceae bacterium]|nr:anthranilate phosphoribosyltransferase [Gimesia sp.]HAH43345.1 anthranilate phosphoribosyltransferase [Planctomycetaceae bacterium]HBL47426.1 anthranilate phosphoribosyltransferase [Planctomycetaceae bacterium]|tara:strand:- start:5836 stop:6846 length:1011 start_codon:yes stop_codon:yes gene_type:complete
MLNRILEGEHLESEAAYEVVSSIMQGECSEVQIAAILTALRMKGETPEELVGAARAMQERALKIPADCTGLLDTCGTGGDQLHTFNISTAVALVAAAAGIPVAKHGNRSVSSSSGSSDVLQTLGVKLELTPEQIGQCLKETGIGFCFAPLLHSAMKYVAPVRRELGIRTIFNYLGPLTNPAQAEYQLLGANSVQAAEKIAQALLKLGRKHALVVCGNGELDEVSLWGKTSVFEITGADLRYHEWTAADFGLPECDVSQLVVNSSEQSAQIILEILNGEQGPARDIVVANAAAALLAADQATNLKQAVQKVAQLIDEGKVFEKLKHLIKFTSKISGE